MSVDGRPQAGRHILMELGFTARRTGVHLFGPAPGSGAVRSVGRAIKAGRTVFVAGVEFTSERGEPVATAAMSFMSAPDPAARLPSRLSVDLPPDPEARRLAVPLAERAGTASASLELDNVFP
jgi:hypothetical protein